MDEEVGGCGLAGWCWMVDECLGVKMGRQVDLVVGL